MTRHPTPDQDPLLTGADQAFKQALDTNTHAGLFSPKTWRRMQQSFVMGLAVAASVAVIHHVSGNSSPPQPVWQPMDGTHYHSPADGGPMMHTHRTPHLHKHSEPVPPDIHDGAADDAASWGSQAPEDI